MKFVITGGGTGGHTMPALSIALAARQAGAEILYIGSERGVERKIVTAHDFEFHALDVYPLSKPLSVSGIKALLKFALATSKAKKLLSQFQPDLVFGTGGYAAAAVVKAQLARKGKVVLHEQNTVPGRVNRWIGQKANVVCLTFDESASFFGDTETVVTGIPLRQEALQTSLSREEARKRFGLSPDKFTVVVSGGSQGAQGLNETVISTVQHVSAAKVQWLHVCGERHAEQMRQTASRIGLDKNYKVWAFLEGEDSANAYQAADMMVCRSGASTLAEVAAWGLPSVLVPFPHAFANHQRLNAEYFTKRGAAELIDQADLSPLVLAKAIDRWREDETLKLEVGRRAKALAVLDATERVMQVIDRVAKQPEGVGQTALSL